jgi:O-antigen ligase/Flp pilus assembly protein TadD
MQTGSVNVLARWTALGTLFLLPFAPLVVANSLFFPFITGKAFYIRTLIEVLVAAWAVLALVDKDYRPRFSWTGVSIAAFVAWMFVADLFAINVVKAFWSNFERMEGWILLIHLLGFFIAAGAVLRVEKKWRAWFLTSLAASLLISLYALFQIWGSFAIHQGSTRIDATLGNSAYLAIYLLFSVFVSLWLSFTEKINWLKWSLAALAVLEAVLIFYTETRGTILGLVAGLGLAAVLFAITGSGRTRRYALAALLSMAVSVFAFYLARDSAVVQNNHILQRITSISLADGQTRFTIWSMALEGVKERPVLGWGQEGFNYVFNKYYKPSMYRQEPWFDRAHNAFIDWLMAGGIPAFLLYLSLFGTALVLLWRRSELSRAERIALTSALVGYGIHNLFVFDNLYSYIYFFAILALIDSQVSRPIAAIENAPTISSEHAVTYAVPIATVAGLFLIWCINLTQLTTASQLIKALSSDPATATQVFESLSASSSFALQEIREQIVSYAAAIATNKNVSDEQKLKIVTLAITEMGKQVNRYPLDTREHLQLSYAYRVSGDYLHALQEIDEALKLSPTKQQIWLEKAALAWAIGDTKAARAAVHTAYDLSPEFSELSFYAAAGDYADGDVQAGDTVLLEAIGTTTADSNILAAVYYQTKNWEKLTALWRLRALEPSASPETWFSLAAVYYTAGDRANAIITITEAMSRFSNNPDVIASGNAAIQQIKEEK